VAARVARTLCYTDLIANLTLTIDEALLLRARQRALAQGTSVNAVVRDYLESFAGAEEIAQAGRAFVALAQRASGSSGDQGRTWTRADLHER
jgi:uncharacterized protein DUF6364